MLTNIPYFPPTTEGTRNALSEWGK